MQNEYDNYKPCNFDSPCPAVGHQEVEVCVPVEVKPFAEVGKIKTQCVGKAVVAKCDKCQGEKKRECKFTITQKIKVEIPVVFGANTKVGEAHCNFDCDQKDKPCKECHEDKPKDFYDNKHSKDYFDKL